MLDMCCKHEGGKLTVTDPDIIERSNLNRQFLFKQKDVGSFKSEAAAGAVVAMRPSMCVEWATDKVIVHPIHVILRCGEQVCPETEDKYSDDFLQDTNATLNALDNVKAREYVDQRCVATMTPLIDSGTTGAPGGPYLVAD